MEIFVPNTVRVARVTVPPSKSYAQRAIVAAAMAQPATTIRNTGISEDVFAMAAAVQKLGAAVVFLSNHFIVTGKKREPEVQINCGESGLAARILACIAPTFGSYSEITGKGSLLRRSMKDLEEFLPCFGVKCTTEDGHLPIKLDGALRGATTKIDGSKSSQYLTGLLMALPVCRENSVLEVDHLVSTPYIDVTIDVLRQFNIHITHENYKRFFIEGGQTYKLLKKEFIVEGDFSAAAAFAVFGAISDHPVILEGLNPDSAQADRIITFVLELAGANVAWKRNGLYVSKNQLKPFDFNANHCPDLFPVLVALAAACDGTSRIEGIGRLKNKESDRGLALQKEFAKLGLKIDLAGNFMLVHGTRKLNSGTIDSHNDHRIAMAGAIAACLTDNGITVTNADAVAKSYPEFWNVMGVGIG
jgi:3-phosphoshikimate 1-carboxyvinyltransferase